MFDLHFESHYTVLCFRVVGRGGQYGKNILSRFVFFKYHDFTTILCHVGFTILSEQCSQTNFPIIKTKPFKVKNYI